MQRNNHKRLQLLPAPQDVWCQLLLLLLLLSNTIPPVNGGPKDKVKSGVGVVTKTLESYEKWGKVTDNIDLKEIGVRNGGHPVLPIA